jgi:DNA-directed RNA polymerase omega subunit
MIKDIVLSRGTGIDTEKCVANSGGSRFDLVLIATARARELRNQHHSSLARRDVHTVVTALEDIQAGKIDAAEYLRKATRR